MAREIVPKELPDLGGAHAAVLEQGVDRIREHEMTLTALLEDTLRDAPRLTVLGLPDSLAAAAEEEDEERARSDIGRCLAPMVGQLPAGYREAVVLSELEGRSQKEVAALQGLSLSGAKSRVQRGRALLRDMILECCRVEFDGRGRAIDYETRGGGPCSPPS